MFWSSSSSRRSSSQGASSSRRRSSQGSATGGAGNTPPPPAPPSPPPPPPEPVQPQPFDDDNIRPLGNRSINSGRGVLDLSVEARAQLNSQLQRFGWEHISDNFIDFYCPHLIFEFYGRANFFYENGDIFCPAVVSRVVGQPIFLNTHFLSLLLGIPNEGECIFFKKRPQDLQNALQGVPVNIFLSSFLKNNYANGRIYERHLQENYRNLNCFLEANVLPKACTNNSISRYQGFIIHCNITHRRLNLAYIMIKYMYDIIQNESLGLGYGALLTHFFSILGIPIHNFYQIRSMLPLSRRTQALRDSHPFQMPQEDEPEEQAEPQNEEQVPQQYGAIQPYQPPPPPPPPQPPHDDDYYPLGPDLYYDLHHFPRG